jgi:hypothetical protein
VLRYVSSSRSLRRARCPWLEIGITSVVPGDCDTNTADFFTAVLPIESWIESEISAPTPAPPPPVTTTTTTTPAPAPTTTTPAPTTTMRATAASPTLARMTVAAARIYTRKVLVGVFHGRYTAGNSKKLTCSRTSATRLNCGANFSFGANDYYGNVIVYYEFGTKDGTVWSDRYTLHWVNDHCYFHTLHRRECKISTRRGAF